MTPDEKRAEANRLHDVEGITNMREIGRRLGVHPTRVAEYLGKRVRDDHKSPSPRMHIVRRRGSKA
jgi:hypothetical protein